MRRVGWLVVAACAHAPPTVASIEWVGTSDLATAELPALLETRDGGVNVPGRPLDAAALERSIAPMRAWYFDRGHVLATVEHAEQLDDGAVRVTVRVFEGRPYRYRKIAFKGPDAEQWQEQAPFKAGDVYNRAGVAAYLNVLTYDGGITCITPYSTTGDAWVDLTFVLERSDAGCK